MGKLRDIPVLKAALAERTQRLRNAGAGVSDAAAARMGLTPIDDFHRAQPGLPARANPTIPDDMPMGIGLERVLEELANSVGILPQDVKFMFKRDDATQAAAMAAMSQGVGMSDKAFGDAISKQYPRGNGALVTQFGNENAALLAENGRLKAERDAVARRNDEMERKLKPVRSNPATGRDELWDIEAELKDIRAQIPRDRRLEGYTTAGAVEHMARLLASAEARATPEDLAVDLLRAVKLEPGMLIALRGGETTTNATLRRVAEGIDKTLRARFGSMTYGSPVVVMLPPDSSMETVPTGGRGAVQVNIHEDRKARPTDVPKDVARIYAVAAADSFGVTPEVVRRKRSERRAADAVRLGLGPAPVESVYVRRDYRCWYVDLALCDADGMPLPTEGDAVSGISGPASELLTQFVTKVSAPIPRGERRPVGTLIGWEDPDDLLLADAPAGEA